MIGWLKGWITEGKRVPGPRALPAYAALHRPGVAGADLLPQLIAMVRQLAAQRSGCLYCIHHGRHLAMQAGLSETLLDALDRFGTSPLFTESERAALAFTEAVTCYQEERGGLPGGILAQVRRYFTEAEVAAIVVLTAEEHFYNSGRGALGYDALRGRR